MDKIKANKTVKRQGAGRPKIVVDIEILKNLASIGCPDYEIASVLNIGPYRIPVSLPQDVEGTASIPVDFSIFEGGVTRINLSIKPFESMSRYQDSYVFDRIIEVESVNYYDEDFYNQIITDNN